MRVIFLLLASVLGVAHLNATLQEAVSAKKTNQILIEGEVVKQGLYDFIPGMTLSQIILKAGGFTKEAYPIGAVFLRDFKEGPRKRARMIVEADYVILQMKPEFDIALQAGDHLIIPKRPAHVWVEGGVKTPQAILFQSGLSARDYIQKAGGPVVKSGYENVKAVFPDGTVKMLHLTPWRYKNTKFPPGTRIIVE